MSKVTIYQDEAGFWRWRLQARNGKVVAQGEGHSSPRDAKRAFIGVQRAAKAPKWASIPKS